MESPISLLVPDWQTLYDDVLIRVFSFLPARALLHGSETCKNWHRVANDEVLWKNLFYRTWQIDTNIPRALGKASWQGEYKRLFYYTPAIESEVIQQHNDQVLHVSFSHNGSMFATSSKDGHIKVWDASFPVSLKFQEDMKRYTWKYTQFSQFNETDTLLLVSGVHFGTVTTSGEIAVFSVTEGFDLQCRVMNKPYDVFGTWYNESYLLSGNLYWLGHLVSCSALWLNKAFQAVDFEQESVSMRLFKFHNVNASSIRTIMVANCWTGDSDEIEDATGVGQERHLDLHHRLHCEHQKKNGIHPCAGGQKMQNMSSVENGTFRLNLLEVDDEESGDRLNGTIEYNASYRQAENAYEEDRLSELKKVADDHNGTCVFVEGVSLSGQESKMRESLSEECHDYSQSPSKQMRSKMEQSIGCSSDVFHAGQSTSSPKHRPQTRTTTPVKHSCPSCDSVSPVVPSNSKSCCDKYLIFTTGSLTYTPHQIGIKRIRTLEAFQNMEVCHNQRGARLLPNVGENLPGGYEQEYTSVDKLINLHGHIIGMSLSPDHRYLYVNNRPWPKKYHIEDPLHPPPIAQQIDIHVIDLLHMKEVGTMHRSHKAYTPNDECFFIFLDVCDEYVASGAEDGHGYLWDRHYGLCLQKFKHNDVVNAVAFNPQDREMVISVSDDASIKIWRSRNRENLVKSKTSNACTMEFAL